MSEPLRQILVHFTHVSALLVATWGLKKFVLKFKGQGRDKIKGMKKSASHRLLPSPEQQFEPPTPKWMKEWIKIMNGNPSLLDDEMPIHIYKIIQESIADKRNELQLGSPKILKDLFLLDRKSCKHFLNHGSFGATFRFAADAQEWYQDLLEKQPVYFYENTAVKVLEVAKMEVAKLIGASKQDLVPVVNATSAINSVLYSLQFKPGDLVLITSITYPAVMNAVARHTSRANAGMVFVNLDLETLKKGNDAVIERFASIVRQYGSRIQLAIVDHISSNPTYHMPLERLIQLFKTQNIPVCVDGAHAVFAKDISMGELDADFYTSNLHKWGCCPKSCAFLWVHPRNQALMIPVVTSQGYKQGWQAEFAWPGTVDASPWLSVPTVFKVWNAIGISKARVHNHEKLRRAVEIIQKAWGSHLAVLGADTVHSTMASLEVPELKDFDRSSEGALGLHIRLRDDFGIDIPTQCWEGSLWCRISSQIFNIDEDYQALCDAILALRKIQA